MRKLLLCSLILSFVLFSGCSKQTITPLNSDNVVAPSPTIGDTELPETTSSKPPKEDAIDLEGNFNGNAVIANLGSFTVDELIEFFPKSDGAYADGITEELSKRLQNNLNGVISSLTNADLSNDMRDKLAWLIGVVLRLREITDNESEILYSAGGLGEQEQNVLNKIIEGFEADI